MNRTLAGVSALSCLALALAIWTTHPADPSWRMWMSGFVRVGLLLSAIWLALPTDSRNAAWTNVTPRSLLVVLLVVVALVRLKLKIVVIFVAVLAVATLVLRPRGKQRPKNRGESPPESRAKRS